MAWEFQCPVHECDYDRTRNEEVRLIEDAQQHMDGKHGNMPTRDEVEQYVVGP